MKIPGKIQGENKEVLMTTKLQPVPKSGKIKATSHAGQPIKGIRYYIAKLRSKVAKHVTFDKDGVFKDPDWPHLWDHKR